MTAANRSILEYTDVAGAFLRSSNWTQLTGSSAALAAAIQNATNANLAFLTAAQPIVGATTPSNALYQSVQDILQVTMQTALGNQVQVPIPAPLGTMFQSGGILINPADATWIALLAAIVANVTDVAGNAALTLVSAVKTSRRSDQNG